MDWKSKARMAIDAAAFSPDPEAVPEYLVPNRRWWFQFWKPKWRIATGVSRAQLMRVQNAELRRLLDVMNVAGRA